MEEKDKPIITRGDVFLRWLTNDNAVDIQYYQKWIGIGAAVGLLVGFILYRTFLWIFSTVLIWVAIGLVIGFVWVNRHKKYVQVLLKAVIVLLVFWLIIAINFLMGG